MTFIHNLNYNFHYSAFRFSVEVLLQVDINVNANKDMNILSKIPLHTMTDNQQKLNLLAQQIIRKQGKPNLEINDKKQKNRIQSFFQQMRQISKFSNLHFRFDMLKCRLAGATKIDFAYAYFIIMVIVTLFFNRAPIMRNRQSQEINIRIC